MAVSKKRKPATFLSARQFRKIKEQTRRQRISAALKARHAKDDRHGEPLSADDGPSIDLSTGFDPATDD